MPTIYNMTCTSQGAGTEEGKPGWGQNQLLLEDSTALPVSVKPGPCPQTYLSSIIVDPGAWIQCETTDPYAALHLPLASTFCISYFHFKPCGVLRESATLLSDPGKFFLPGAASCCRERVNMASGVTAGGNVFPIVLRLLISHQNSDNY